MRYILLLLVALLTSMPTYASSNECVYKDLLNKHMFEPNVVPANIDVGKTLCDIKGLVITGFHDDKGFELYYVVRRADKRMHVISSYHVNNEGVWEKEFTNYWGEMKLTTSTLALIDKGLVYVLTRNPSI